MNVVMNEILIDIIISFPIAFTPFAWQISFFFVFFLRFPPLMSVSSLAPRVRSVFSRIALFCCLVFVSALTRLIAHFAYALDSNDECCCASRERPAQ